MTANICLDLFAGIGGFSSAFEDSPNWKVTTVEIEPSLDPDICADIMDLRPTDLPDADVVLASPPCTMFSLAGNHDAWDFETHEPLTDRAREHVALVYHTIGLIQALSPDFWFLENPRGRLRWFLGEPAGTVTYCQYGRDNQKPTDLWGDHPPGMTYRPCVTGADCHVESVNYDGTSAVASMSDDYHERSAVPRELSEDILRAVEGRSRQQPLTEVLG